MKLVFNNRTRIKTVTGKVQQKLATEFPCAPDVQCLVEMVLLLPLKFGVGGDRTERTAREKDGQYKPYRIIARVTHRISSRGLDHLGESISLRIPTRRRIVFLF